MKTELSAHQASGGRQACRAPGGQNKLEGNGRRPRPHGHEEKAEKHVHAAATAWRPGPRRGHCSGKHRNRKTERGSSLEEGAGRGQTVLGLRPPAQPGTRGRSKMQRETVGAPQIHEGLRNGTTTKNVPSNGVRRPVPARLR